MASRHEYDADLFEREVARIGPRLARRSSASPWFEHCGEERGNALLRRYALALPLAYRDQVPPTSAVSDLERLETAETSGRIESQTECALPAMTGRHQHLKLFLNGEPRPLSTVLPVLENLGVTVLSEQPFNLTDNPLHIADFAIRLPNANTLDDEPTAPLVHRSAGKTAA